MDFNFAEAINNIIAQFSEDMLAAKERALNNASDYMIKRLEANSPVQTGGYQKGWTRTEKYKSVRYLGNGKLNDKGIPVSNLLEYGSKGKPHIRKTFNEEYENISNIIKKELQK